MWATVSTKDINCLYNRQKWSRKATDIYPHTVEKNNEARFLTLADFSPTFELLTMLTDVWLKFLNSKISKFLKPQRKLWPVWTGLFKQSLTSFQRHWLNWKTVYHLKRSWFGKHTSQRSLMVDTRTIQAHLIYSISANMFILYLVIYSFFKKLC